jgi:hypothetical protein
MSFEAAHSAVLAAAAAAVWRTRMVMGVDSAPPHRLIPAKCDRHRLRRRPTDWMARLVNDHCYLAMTDDQAMLPGHPGAVGHDGRSASVRFLSGRPLLRSFLSGEDSCGAAPARTCLSSRGLCP